ncbi:MAG TPA: SUMF1/EgtB/PvdO family nonheme iron enzyme, partial [Polyangiaceae bacterium]|nr:SUMF1/EgtB/PvdO family nonheme iron enzyme [Polyangiaceae bacterium]
MARLNPTKRHAAAAGGVLCVVCFTGGCDRLTDERAASASAVGSSAAPDGSRASTAPPPPSGARVTGSAGPSAAVASPPPPCPAGTRPIAGGELWIGTRGTFPASENSPRFAAVVAPFCLDRTEVTVGAYTECVRAGACTPAHDGRRFCNAGRPEREDHPINCVDWHQAAAYCRHRQARLPTEVEWEYAARGGARDLPYPWGDGALDAHTCWKHPGGSCRVGQFPEDVFGLVDVIGNVWEWTDTWFGEYPFSPAAGRAKVYRGGSWSRRFEKWMSPRLRNRYRPDEWGSHLGFRCALTLPGTPCPGGARSDGAGCAHGVREVDCPPGKAWNGARCAGPRDGLCPAGRRPEPGQGCVLEVSPSGSAAAPDLSGVTRAPSP